MVIDELLDFFKESHDARRVRRGRVAQSLGFIGGGLISVCCRVLLLGPGTVQPVVTVTSYLS
jgi:hypothetical protein